MSELSADNDADAIPSDLDWSRLKEIVADALEQPAEERLSFISRLCGNDDTLRREAETLVLASDANESKAHLLHARVDSFLGLGNADPRTFGGRRFGRYSTLRLIGEGGMSAVYLAKQDGVDRPVALKILRSDSLGYDAKRRFLQEVTALSRIEHPGVARIFDAGLADDPSLPGVRAVRFIAMEFVDGPPLNAWATQKRLTLDDRLRLLADVADAVHAAHQRGIIHRDLKPANVLVVDDGGYGRPNVLDFGIARVLRPASSNSATFHTSHTTAGVILGTLGYMSPEQARGEADSDLRADIWALGVLLHELLTGRLPINTQNLALPEAMRRVAESDVTAGTVGPITGDTTGGDLHAILVTALANEPARRYASAEAMANDLRRVLRHEPVLARHPTRTYIARKFIRRHRAAATAAVLVAAALGLGTMAATISAVREHAARKQAVAARNEAEKSLLIAETQSKRSLAARNVLSRVLESADIDNAGAGRDLTLLDAIRSADAKLAEYVNGDRLVESEVRLTFARALRSLADIDGADHQYDLAIAAARAAVAGAEQVATPATWAIELQLEQAGLLANETRIERARSLYDAARAELSRLPADAQRPRLELEADKTLAALLAAEGDFETAADLWLKVVDRGTKMVDAPEATRITSDELATMQNNAGSALLDAGRADDAIKVLQTAVAYRRTNFGATHPVTLHAIENLGHALDGVGRLDEAEALAKQLLADATKTFGPDHPTVSGARAVWISVLTQRQDPLSLEQALKLEDENITALEKRGAEKSADMAVALNNRAVTLTYLKRFDEAAKTDERAIAVGMTSVGEDHPIVLSARGNLAQALIELGQRDAGAKQLKTVLDVRRRVLGEEHQSTTITRNNLAMLAVDANDTAGSSESVTELAACLDIATRSGWTSVAPLFRRNLGRALLLDGQFDRAEEALKQAYAESADISPEQQRKTAHYLAELYKMKNDLAAAAEWREKSNEH